MGRTDAKVKVKETKMREAIGNILVDPTLSLCIKRYIHVDLSTLNRWGNGETTPSKKYIQEMLTILPLENENVSILQQIYNEIYESDTEENYISPEITRKIISCVPNGEWPFVYWTVSKLVLSNMVRQLDPYKKGIQISIILCTPSLGEVHTLRDDSHIGYGPWLSYDIYHFYGENSLIGNVIQKKEMITFSKHDFNPLLYTFHSEERSVCIYPIIHYTMIAGCIRIKSTQDSEYFTEVRKRIISDYAILLGLGIEKHHFYPQERIHLVSIPSQERQKALLTGHRISKPLLGGNDEKWREAEQFLLTH